MKRNLPAVLILLALAGLTFVQFRLLIIGARLEKQRFDQRAAMALRNISADLDSSNPVSDSLVACLKNGTLAPGEKLRAADSLQVFLQNSLDKADIHARFSFAITPRYSKEPELTSRSFDRSHFTYDEYSVELGDYFSGRLYGVKTLHIDVENLFGYLLTELDYLVIPSVLCLLTILVCLGFLLYILRKEHRLNRVKNDFINNLTHELKTPAFSISLARKLLAEKLAAGDLKKAGEILPLIEKETEKLKVHIEKVLELASLESHRYSFQMEPTNMHTLVTEVASEFTSRVEQLQGNLTCHLNARTCTCLADADHFRNVLRNLIDNALKYNDNAPEILIETRNSGSHFLLIVQDNGIGIPPEFQKQVFDKFFRIPSGDSNSRKGFGLGLSYVHQIVKAHHGKIKLESSREKGTRITVRLVNELAS